VRFDPVLLLFAVIARRPAIGETPRPADYLLLPEKIRALQRTVLICRPKNQPVSQIQRQNLRLITAKRGDKRRR